LIAYIDTSVVMRIVLNDPHQLPEWSELRDVVSSRLLQVEALRALDQLWHRGKLTHDTFAEKAARFRSFLPRIEILPLNDEVFDRASLPLPTELGTLDCLHLATAILYRASRRKTSLLFATHDLQLARAARAMQFEVIGA
jgi:predicted nucleic acid-binding protein